MKKTIEGNLEKSGIVLPEVTPPVANYVSYTVSGNIVFVSGQLPSDGGKFPYMGQLGAAVSLEDGVKAARLCGINLLAQLQKACRDLTGRGLESVTKVLKVEGFVSSTPDFKDHPKVINGVSDLMVNVFGDIGKHARAAVGVSSLPLGVPVEVAAIFEIDLKK